MTPTPEVRAVLLRAAEIVEKPGAWTQGAYAKTAEGLVTSSQSPDATCWCMVGAVMRACDGDAKLESGCWYAILGVLGSGCVPDFNDAPGRTASEVAAKLREAAGGCDGR